MSSYFSNVQNNVPNHNGKHCPSCQCTGTDNFLRWRAPREQAPIASSRISQFVHSRIVPQNDPISQEVGQNVIPNRTVWFKSVPPKPAKITIRVSSPDRPNLRPSEGTLSVHKRAPSESRISFRGIQVSQVADPEHIPSTPLKKIRSKNSIDTYDQSTIYSPINTERKVNETILTNTSQHF